jgi:hypothetical protein
MRLLGRGKDEEFVDYLLDEAHLERLEKASGLGQCSVFLGSQVDTKEGRFFSRRRSTGSSWTTSGRS